MYKSDSKLNEIFMIPYHFWQKFHRWVLMNIQGDPVKIFHKTKIQPNASTYVGTK